MAMSGNYRVDNEQVVRRVANEARKTALTECLDIVTKAKDDLKCCSGIETVIALREVERLIKLLPEGIHV